MENIKSNTNTNTENLQLFKVEEDEMNEKLKGESD